jgi:hypothetical protein
LLEKRISGSQGVSNASFVGSNSVVGHGPGAAVNQENGLRMHSIFQFTR